MEDGEEEKEKGEEKRDRKSCLTEEIKTWYQAVMETQRI